MFYKVLIINVFAIILNLHALDFNKLKSIESDFTQTIVNSSNKIIKYKGKLFIQEPSKILWKYNTPVVKNVYILNTFVIIDEPELEQAIYTTLNSEINILALLKSSKKIAANVFQSEINEVKYNFFIKDNKITKIKYEDELENKVTISFSNSIYNKEIKKEVFVFNAPDYYDIIRK
ncbi:MAG: outer-membrane lipoprotein carrier protein LolA [Campylobacteraceae bacterium]|nr:outer-membrane lipoprotein carrier protein LolA [Campylobacteraceae bacterium]